MQNERSVGGLLCSDVLARLPDVLHASPVVLARRPDVLYASPVVLAHVSRRAARVPRRAARCPEARGRSLQGAARFAAKASRLSARPATRVLTRARGLTFRIATLVAVTKRRAPAHTSKSEFRRFSRG